MSSGVSRLLTSAKRSEAQQEASRGGRGSRVRHVLAGKQKKYEVDPCVRLEQRNDKTEGGEAGVGVVGRVVSAIAVKTHEVNLEISVARVEGSINPAIAVHYEKRKKPQ